MTRLEPLRNLVERTASRRVVLIGGKGGVGKTTVSALLALERSEREPTILFTTDPASNLADIFGSELPDNLTLEAVDGDALYRDFLRDNLESLLEVGDRGTYFDREELRRLFELAVPGIDELMAWLRIGDLAARGGSLIVDTAPTGHTLRMLGASGHFRQLVAALDTMEEKHRALVRQLTRRDVRDAIDDFITRLDERGARVRALLADPATTAFVPVALAEPLVVEQTLRLANEVREAGLDVPVTVLNRAACCDCASDLARARDALSRLGDAIALPRSCAPLDSISRLRSYMAGETPQAPPVSATMPPARTLSVDPAVRLLFFAGKGGVGKTTCASSVALQAAASHPERRVIALSVDPAHSLPVLLGALTLPQKNLTVETIDTKKLWRDFRDSLGGEISRAVDAVTPRGLTVAYDREALESLLELAPPGADELFAITRLADLVDEEAFVVVDTAPTGHFLRLLDLPADATEWVHEFMRLLVRYRELIPAGSLGEELLRASRALKKLQQALTSPPVATVVVTRPERIVIAETKRLIDELRRRKIALAGVIANAVTPESGCACDRIAAAFEVQALADIGREFILVERRAAPPESANDLATLLPLA